MGKIENFAKTVEILKQAKNQGTEITNFQKEVFKSNVNKENHRIDAFIDYAAGSSEKWREEFNKGFSLEFGQKYEYIRKLSEEDKQNLENFAVSRSGVAEATIGNIIQTNIMTARDDLFRKTSILSKVNVITDTNSYRIPEFGNEIEADRINENAVGTSKDDVARSGDLLTLDGSANKLKVYNRLTRLALKSLSPADLGKMQARLARALMRKIEREIFLGSNANSQACGFINTTTGATAFGALTTTFSTVVGTRPVNHIDALEAIVGDLSGEIDDSDLSKYNYVLNRPTKTKIVRTVDVNNNFYFDSLTESQKSLLSGITFYTSSVMSNDVVGLFDLSKYYALIDTMPTLELYERESEEVDVKLVLHMDGGISMGYKTLADGTTANTAKNAHRVATLKADYTA